MGIMINKNMLKTERISISTTVTKKKLKIMTIKKKKEKQVILLKAMN